MQRLRRWLRQLGPGLITGASDDDPSGIGTYAQAGAAFGLATLWTAWITLVMMAAVQDICARIGLVSARGLAAVLRRCYPRAVVLGAVGLLFVANTINIGADIGAIAYGLNLVTGIQPAWLWLPIALLLLAWLTLGSYRTIARVFKWLTLSLFAYVAVPFLIELDWGQVLHQAVVPRVQPTAAFLTTMVALWGTTISPYLFFWQADMEAEETTSPGATTAEVQAVRVDVITGMVFSNVVMFFIILTTGATLHKAGITDIQTAQQAAEALRPFAGDYAYALFAGGLVGTGMLAVPILAGSSAYAIGEAFGWRVGLDQPVRRAKPFYGVLAAGFLFGVAMDYMGFNPIKALFWAAVLNGVAAPPLLVLVMLVSNDPRVMGRHVNGRWQNALGWLVTITMALMAGALLVTTLWPSR
jgi:NRAMP (natural resistance-associated macrophage protein)-like metal ion transporter